MAKADWNVEQYEKFKAERLQPGLDLLAGIERRPALRCLDLGCGTGELTRILHESLQAETTLGVDVSDSMLAKASTHQARGLQFEKGDIGTFTGGPFDVIFSNAALQWVHHHDKQIPRIAAMLAGGGQLAIQMPFNQDHPSHSVAFEIEKEPPFQGIAHSDFEANVLPIQRYAEILDGIGLQAVSVRMQVYLHHLESRETVIEWTKGTFLLDYQKSLPEELFALFLERYRERLLARLPDNRPFLFTFKRILMYGRKPGS